MTRYVLRPIDPTECEGECEWITFTAATAECEAPMTHVIIDHDDPEPGGFHWAHLCDEHAPLAYEAAEAAP